MANRLAQEKSPYLLQHAENPVDWYPWGEAAFARARAEEKPIFLSIGYATCHWCHVMERESFESEEVAAYLNEHFVSVKVDREERPDVDELYMSVVQALTGQGGWPLSVFLTPEGRPFYGGTYFPHPPRFGRPGFVQLLEKIHEVWEERREQVEEDAKQIAEHVAKGPELGRDELREQLLEHGFAQLKSTFDGRRGGFGAQMKFPTPHNLTYLLRYHRRTGKAEALAMVMTTLDAMLRGGLRDHLGGGFHRYAVDPEWRIPHFEKMLYDQAGLLQAYVEAHQVTGEARYAAVARETADFVLREMRDPGGAFTSAWDADSEGVEGKFYVWTEAELKELLGPDDFPLFAARYGVSAAGNFHELPGANHLQLHEELEPLAERHGLTVEALEERLEGMRRRLLEARTGRVPPLHDDKVLTDWNGLMIGSLALAGRALDEPRYTQAAVEAARFLGERLRDEEGRLLHRYRQGEAAIAAFLDDYAFLGLGLLELYATTFDPAHLAAARDLARGLAERFEDPAEGGFFSTSADTELIHRSKPRYDGAIPSGNATAALLLVRLGRLIQDEQLEARGRRALEAASGFLAQAGGHGGAFALQALDFLLGPVREVVVAGPADAPETRELLREVHHRFLPRTLVVHRPPGDAREVVDLVPFVAAQTPRDDQPTAYVCRDYACQAPVTEPAELATLLG